MNASFFPSIELQAACASFDLAQARIAAAQLVNWLEVPMNILSEPEARRVIAQVIENRWFDVAEQIATPLAAQADASPTIVRRYAQILMERGRFDDALTQLNTLSEIKGLRAVELYEVVGHIGRLYKDQFMVSLTAKNPNETYLKHSIDAYLKSYHSDPEHNLWHGINAVAMLSLAKRIGLEHARLGDPNALAKDIVESVNILVETQKATPYDLATAAEALVALGDYWKAIEYLKLYMPGATVFALGSTLRQFEQIWGLGKQPPPAPQLLDLLRAEQMRKTNGIVHLQRTDLDRDLHSGAIKLEAVFGADRFETLDNYRKGLARCACVARITRNDGSGGGTGFLLPGRLLSSKLPETFVLITNAHVVSENDALRVKGALHPAETVVTFTAMDHIAPSDEFKVEKILFQSPPEMLDTVILQLKPQVVPHQAYPIAPVLPVAGSEAQVKVIGHPSGGVLSISVNRLLDHEAPRIHYRAATEGGSSGSPVFNSSWDLVGLHHSGGDAMPRLKGVSGSYQANEGIWIKSVGEAVNS